MNIYFEDMYTSEDRVGWFYKRKLRKSAEKVFIIVGVVTLIVGLYFADLYLQHMTDKLIEYGVQQQMK